jgi:hypothetical protein
MPINFQTRAASFAASFSLAAIVVLPSCAQVESNAIGALEARLGDQAYAGEFLEIPSEGTTTASFRSFGPVTNVSLQAHDPEAESRMRNVLTLEYSVMGSDATASVTSSTVTYWPNGMSGAFYTSDEGGGETNVSLESLSFESESPRAVGVFTSTVCAKESFMTEINMDDCLPVEGRFETAIKQAN